MPPPVVLGERPVDEGTVIISFDDPDYILRYESDTNPIFEKTYPSAHDLILDLIVLRVFEGHVFRIDPGSL